MKNEALETQKNALAEARARMAEHAKEFAAAEAKLKADEAAAMGAARKRQEAKEQAIKAEQNAKFAKRLAELQKLPADALRKEVTALAGVQPFLREWSGEMQAQHDREQARWKALAEASLRRDLDRAKPTNKFARADIESTSDLVLFRSGGRLTPMLLGFDPATNTEFYSAFVHGTMGSAVTCIGKETPACVIDQLRARLAASATDAKTSGRPIEEFLFSFDQVEDLAEVLESTQLAVMSLNFYLGFLNASPRLLFCWMQNEEARRGEGSPLARQLRQELASSPVNEAAVRKFWNSIEGKAA